MHTLFLAKQIHRSELELAIDLLLGTKNKSLHKRQAVFEKGIIEEELQKRFADADMQNPWKDVPELKD